MDFEAKIFKSWNQIQKCMYVPPVDKRKKELEQEVEELRKKLFEQNKLIEQLQKELEELKSKPVKIEEKPKQTFTPIANMLKRGMYWIYDVLNPDRVFVDKYHDFVKAEEQEEKYLVSEVKGNMIILSKEVFSTIKGGERYREQDYYYISKDGRYYYLEEDVETGVEEIIAGEVFEDELPKEIVERLVLSDARTLLWRDLGQNKEGEQVEVNKGLEQVVLYEFLGKEKRKYDKIGEREVYHLHLPREDKYVLDAYSMPDDLFYDAKTGLLLEDTNRKLKSTNIPL